MAMLKSLHINIPFLEAMTQMPPYAKFLKELLSNKKKLSDECITLPHQVSALVQRTLPTKQCDPGSFTLPVKIGDMETTGALADLGASVSLIPLSIAKKLKFEMIPSRKVIQLADRSTKFPCGELEDVPIKIGNLFVPCDFVVMDMEEDPHTPLILGREALKTMGAVVNCKDNTITCEVANEKYKFEFSKTLKQPMVEKIWRVDFGGLRT
ncbi:DNA damage-inducible protein 1-like [Chenopodium quinoa]|uniref:DNA damage-inducible protein 1-like n=1 Tax=Chenopodium quinoa TaxID=63459 RepID=UPI000B7867EA|nr:DNA damage-inducible protein 1-like [Chenopodium quinoa]